MKMKKISKFDYDALPPGTRRPWTKKEIRKFISFLDEVEFDSPSDKLKKLLEARI